MNPGSISRRYARALLDLATEAQAVARVRKDLEDLVVLLRSHAELFQVLTSPSYTREQHLGILRQVVEGKVHPITHRFLMLLASRSRMALIGSIVDDFSRLHDEAQGIVRVSVTSATPLPEDVETRLERQLEQSLNKKVAFTRQVDPEILGGMITRVGNIQYDGSLATQLSRLRKQLVAGESI